MGEHQDSEGLTILRRLLGYARRIFGLDRIIEQIHDGRQAPRIKTPTIVRTVLVMFLNRLGSLNALEQTRKNPFWKRWVGRKLPLADTLGRVLARVHCDDLRQAIRNLYARRKRNKSLKAFVGGKFVLVLDGHECFASFLRSWDGCLQRILHTLKGDRIQFYQRLVAATLVCGKTRMLIDCELQRPGEDEIAAAIRLVQRILKIYPRAFHIVAADGLYVNPNFFKTVTAAGKHVIAVLKNERRDLIKDARELLAHVKPVTFSEGSTLYKCWDIEGFTTWPQCGQPVRVVRSVETTRVRRQHTGKVETITVEWLWVTTLPCKSVRTRDVVRIGHGRWAIENEGGFNELTTLWKADHVYKHHSNAILAAWLLTFWAYNLFHAFIERNLKPIPWAAYSALHIAQLITADFYAYAGTTQNHPP